MSSIAGMMNKAIKNAEKGGKDIAQDMNKALHRLDTTKGRITPCRVCNGTGTHRSYITTTISCGVCGGTGRVA